MLDVGRLVLAQVDLVEPRPVEPDPLPVADDLGVDSGCNKLRHLSLASKNYTSTLYIPRITLLL